MCEQISRDKKTWGERGREETFIIALVVGLLWLARRYMHQ